MKIYNKKTITRVFIITFTSILLSGCGPSQQQLNAQANARGRLVAFNECKIKYPKQSNVLPYSKCVVQVFNRFGGSDAERVLVYKRLDLAEQIAAGKISYASAQSQYSVVEYQVKSQQQMLENSQAIAKNTNCISQRQRVAGNNYSGVDSTNGAVAIISLLGAVADGASVANACN